MRIAAILLAVLLALVAALTAVDGFLGDALAAKKNPSGANLDGHQLHDDVQRAGGELRDNVPDTRYAADRRRHRDQQCEFEHVVSA